MSLSKSKTFRQLSCGGICLIALLIVTAKANTGEAPATTPQASGNLEFDYPDAPGRQSSELDVGQGMFQDLFGIGEAAVAGVVEGLAQSAAADGGEDEAKATAEGLAAVQHVVQLVGKFVQGARGTWLRIRWR